MLVSSRLPSLPAPKSLSDAHLPRARGPTLPPQRAPVTARPVSHLSSRLRSCLPCPVCLACPACPAPGKVAWFHKDKHTLLALQEKVIFRNGRLRVSSHASTTFYLHVHDVREEDRGAYMCQINTSPMKSQTGHLHVVGMYEMKIACVCAHSHSSTGARRSAAAICRGRHELRYRGSRGRRRESALRGKWLADAGD